MSERLSIEFNYCLDPITTSELEFSAPIDTEYAELAVRTLAHAVWAWMRGRGRCSAAAGLTRISHQTKCIGAANQRKVFLRETLTRMAGIPRCRQSVARRCLNLHPSRTGKWSRVSMEVR